MLKSAVLNIPSIVLKASLPFKILPTMATSDYMVFGCSVLLTTLRFIHDLVYAGASVCEMGIPVYQTINGVQSALEQYCDKCYL